MLKNYFHKQVLAKISLFAILFCMLLSNNSKAQALGCTTQMYLVQGIPSALKEIDDSSNPFSYPIINQHPTGVNINAAGINPLDGYMYGINNVSNAARIYRIGAIGVPTDLGRPAGLPTVNFNTGEIDGAGNFYIKQTGLGNKFYKIVLSTMEVTEITLSVDIEISDWAFNPINGLLYGVGGNDGRLKSINPTTGFVTQIGSTQSFDTVGAMFGTSNGEIYGAINGGGFYQFNTTTGKRVRISNSPNSGQSDGARCVTAPITFDVDLYATKTDGKSTYTPGTSTTYTIVVGNEGLFGVQDAEVSDPVPAGIPAANVSYTAVASAGSSTNVVGTQTGAINDLVSLPVGGTVTYTVTVNIPSSFTGNLVNKVTITAPTNAIDTDLSDNEDTDTDFTPFTCNTKFYLTQYPATGTTTLYELDNTTNPFTITSIGTSPTNMKVNGIGYNTVDNLIYGMRTDTGSMNHMVVIDGNGVFTDLGPVINLPVGGYNSGSFDDAGNYYVLNFGTQYLYKINIATNTATLVTLSRAIQVSDIVYDKTGGKFFGYEGATGTNRLISIDPVTTAVTNIGASGLPDGTFVGALYVDANGDIFGNADNGTGFYQFNKTSGNAVKISNSIGANGNDGANCPDAVITFPADLGVTKTDGKTSYVPGTTNTYTIVVSNTHGPYGVLGATVSDPLPAGIPAANISYTVPVLTGGATTSITGAQTGAINDEVSLPVGSTITYTVTVNIPVAYTGNLTNTVTVTPPVNSTDPTPGNNVATDTDTRDPDCSSLYLIIDSKNSIYDITGLNGILPNPFRTISSSANQVIAVGKDISVPSKTVFTHATGATNSNVYIDNTNTGVQVPNFLNGIAANPIDGIVYANSATSGGGPGNRNMLRVYPNPAILGAINGDAFFNDAANTNLATDSFFDTNGKYYIIAFNNASGSTDKRLYSVDLSTLQATFVMNITGTPVNSRGLQGLAFLNGNIYMAISETFNGGNQFKSIDIYETNPITGSSILKTTYSGIQANFSAGNYQALNLDLATCDVYVPSYCYKPGILDAVNTYPTKHGITALGRAGADNDNWPMTRQSAWTVLESKEKGFVVNRVATTAGLANITNPVEGMMVYDAQADCLKIYTLKSGDSVMGWHCFITPACPD